MTTFRPGWQGLGIFPYNLRPGEDIIIAGRVKQISSKAGMIYTFGYSGAGILHGPGTHQFEWNFLKTVAVDEKRRFEFRTELCNIFNTPQCNDRAPRWGQPLSARSAARARR